MNDPNQSSGPKSIPSTTKASSGPKQVPPAQAQRPPGTEMLAELMQAQRQLTQSMHETRDLRARLSRRSHQMQVLQQVSEILAATSKAGQVVILQSLPHLAQVGLEKRRRGRTDIQVGSGQTHGRIQAELSGGQAQSLDEGGWCLLVQDGVPIVPDLGEFRIPGRWIRRIAAFGPE